MSPCLYDNGKWAEIVDNIQHNSSSTIYTETLTTAECIDKYSHLMTGAERILLNGKFGKTNINSAYGIMNGGNPCNEIELSTWKDACANRIPSTENTTDEILKILNQYMEIEILDTMEEVVLPQLLKSKSLLTIK